MAKASIGRIVHYVDGQGQHVPAIITKVESVESEEKVSIAAFHPTASWTTGGPDSSSKRYPVSSMLFIDSAFVKHDEENKAAKTWHWPEREE